MYVNTINKAFGQTCDYFLDESGWATPLNLCTFGNYYDGSEYYNESFTLTCDNGAVVETWYENNDCTGSITYNETYNYISTCDVGGVTDCDWDVSYFYWCYVTDGSECSSADQCYYWPHYDVDCETFQNGLLSVTDEDYYNANVSLWSELECLSDGTYTWDTHGNRSCTDDILGTFSSCSNPSEAQCVFVEEASTEMPVTTSETMTTMESAMDTTEMETTEMKATEMKTTEMETPEMDTTLMTNENTEPMTMETTGNMDMGSTDNDVNEPTTNEDGNEDDSAITKLNYIKLFAISFYIIFVIAIIYA